MIIGHPLRRRTPIAGPRDGSTAVSVALVGLAAALLGYGVHHLPLLRGHPTVGVAAGLGVAALLAAGLGRLVGGTRPPAPAAIVVAAPGGGRIRPLHRDDLRFCARLHLEALPHGFFAHLGPRFLRAYYATFIESPHAVALVAAVRGHPAGVIVGIIDPPLHKSWVLRHRGPWLALLGATALGARPSLAARFLRTRLSRYARSWRRHRHGETPPAAGNGAPAVLSHIAVLPGARGSGSGARLVRSFEAAASRAGARRAVLTTVTGQDGAGAFYARLGWSRGADHTTPDGDHLEEWTRALDAPAPSG